MPHQQPISQLRRRMIEDIVTSGADFMEFQRFDFRFGA
jgi:hypothetical protein